MNAAHFFYKKIQNIYHPGGSKPSDISDELYYYFDGVIFELHAASQILLQIVNLKSGLNISTNNVSWNKTFQTSLKKKNKNLYDWWRGVNFSPEFHIIESMRQHIAHRGGTFLTSSINGKGYVDVLSIPIRWRHLKGKTYQIPSGKSIDLLDELMSFAQYMNRLYESIIR